MNSKFQPIIFSIILIVGILIGKNFNQKSNVSTNDKINSILNLITTLTHNYKNPRWSSFLEFETFKNDIYSDNYYKFGTAYLFNNDLQIDSSFGFNSKKAS